MVSYTLPESTLKTNGSHGALLAQHQAAATFIKMFATLLVLMGKFETHGAAPIQGAGATGR